MKKNKYGVRDFNNGKTSKQDCKHNPDHVIVDKELSQKAKEPVLVCGNCDKVLGPEADFESDINWDGYPSQAVLTPYELKIIESGDYFQVPNENDIMNEWESMMSSDDPYPVSKREVA